MVTVCTFEVRGRSSFRLPTPYRRIGSDALIGHSGVIEDRLDSAAQPRGGFRLGGPDGRQDFQHVLDGDVRNRHPPDNRVGVGRNGVAPLLVVLRIAPAGFMRRDVVGGDGGERGAGGFLAAFCLALHLPMIDRIEAFRQQLPRGEGG